jgi:hypothetical protein
MRPSCPMYSLAIAAMALPLVSFTVRAQSCLGRAGFDGGRVRAGAEYVRYPGTGGAPGRNQFGADVGLGAGNGPFGDIAVMQAPGTGGGASQTSGTFSGGSSLPLGHGGSMEFCPLASIGYTHLQSQTFTFGGVPYTSSGSARTYQLGGTLGARMAADSVVTFVPFAGAQYTSEHVEVSISSPALPSPTSQKQRFDYRLFEAGVAIVVNRTVTIRPSILRPFGVGPGSNPTTAYSLAFSFNVGAGTEARE